VALLCSCGGDDVVLEWNQILIDAVRANAVTTGATNVGPTWASRNMAIVHAAIFDAVNAIEQDYTPYLVNIKAARGTSVEAAAAAAASRALSALYPAQQATFQATLQDDLADIRDHRAKAKGVQLGYSVADQIIAARQNDGSDVIVPYTPGTDPGDWRPTAPGQEALGPNWPYVTPFVMESGTQFRPAPPPALTSLQYAASFNQVKKLGALNSTVRTPDQTEIAIFWSYDAPKYATPLIMYNQIAETVARQEHNSLAENARMFALVNLAMGDAAIVAWDAKYAYDLWRPVTGIREADTDGNPFTKADPTWLPLGIPETTPPGTPGFPSYTSGHATFGGAAFTVLAKFFGTDRIRFNLTSDQLPGVVRHYNSFSQAANENSASRVYLGVHWSFDNEAGQASGRALGQYVYSNILRPRFSNHHDSYDSPHFSSTPSLSSTLSQTSTPLFSTIPVKDTSPTNPLLTPSPDESPLA
jgi:membrane-associated phospholipid phosphatase